MQLDPAIQRLLALDPSKTSISSHGGAGMSSATTSKISTTLPTGARQTYFLKTGTGRAAEVMFEGEHASLNALHAAVPSICPASLGWGRFEETRAREKSWLVTEFLHLSSSSRRGSSSAAASTVSPSSLAVKLARLHTTPAPVPEGCEGRRFGFPVTTCCGDTPQPNGYETSWAKFFAENRLRFILGRGEERNGSDVELNKLVTTTIERVVPRLIGDDHLNSGRGVMPVVVHGDLWSGNASKGVIGSDGERQPEEVVYDPSACYAHSEYDLGIMRMFGGFGAGFFKEYHKLCPKTEPVEEYEDRILLYELYHHLNHYALFGGGYKSGATSIMKNLIRKYGNDE